MDLAPNERGALRLPKLSGLFDSFDNLDQISAMAVALWLKPTPQVVSVENYLANKILFPQSLPITEYDMKVELAILREALRLNGPKPDSQKPNALLADNPFLNITLRKVLIPERFLRYVPDLVSLTWAFVDGLLLGRKKEDYFWDLWTIVLVDDTDEVIGSLILPQFDSSKGKMELGVLGKNYEIRSGGLTVLPCLKERCEIYYNFEQGKILGKKKSGVEVYGGRLGLMIDGRK